MKAFETKSARARAQLGKQRRADVPRERQGELVLPATRADPLTLLDAIAQDRLVTLLPERAERMAQSAFTYFRGAAVVMAADLAAMPNTGIQTQLCGDAHCLNFGGFASPERNVLVDVNDFDETLSGPSGWDVKRLVTSIVVAGRDNKLRPREIRASARETAGAYRTHMRWLATLPALDVWYGRMDAEHILDDARKLVSSRKSGSKVAEQVATASIHEAVDKLTIGEGFERRFRDDPPALFHSPELQHTGFDVKAILRDYRLTLPPEMQYLLDRYALVDAAVKVVGIGSVGTRCAIVLLAADEHDPLLLQIKEATASVLEAHLGPSRYRHHGERVVRGQRFMQSASDAFLGWASSGPHAFYVRQYKDMKSSADLAGADGDELTSYGRACAQTLAAAHARSGDGAAIAGYLGTSDEVDVALHAFAENYADQNERDYQHFLQREQHAGTAA